MLRYSRRIRVDRSSRASGDRRGATIVIIAILTVVLFSFTAFAIDFGRAYLVNAQLQTSADAAALAGAFELRSGSYQTASAESYAMAVRNKVQNVDPNVLSVEPGFWDDAARTFTAAADWDVPGVNSVRARTGHQMGYTFARVMGFTNIDLAKPAVAAVGYSSVTSCVRPWALDYSVLLSQLPSAPQSTDYDLTADDVAWLAQNEERISLLPNQTEVSPGNIGQAITWTGSSNQYKDAISRECYENSKSIGPGDLIPANPGKASIDSEMQEICNARSNQHIFRCHWPIKVVVYDSYSGSPGANLTFRTKFVGAFVVSCYSKGTGNVKLEDIESICEIDREKVQGLKDAQIIGYFTSMPDDDGSWTTTPSPLIAPVALVQ